MFLKQKRKNIFEYIQLNKYWAQYLIIFSLIIIVAFLFPEGKALKYTYQINDVTREPIIAPFTFSIQKSKEKLQSDIDERIKNIPFVFFREDPKVNEQKEKLEEFFLIARKIIIKNWDMEDSKTLVYERRYHKQYEKAKAEFISDSSVLAISLNNFFEKYPFTKDNEIWKRYLLREKNDKFFKILDQNK